MDKRPSIVYWMPHANAKGFGLYLNITNRCSNNCYFCFRKFKNGVREFNLKLRKEPSSNEIIKELQKVRNRKKWSEVVFCGFGEPLERLNCILEVTKWEKKYYGKAIRLNTNGQGYLLNKGKEVVKELKNAGVDKISISLSAHDQTTYNQVCKPKFENAFEMVLGFVEKAKREDLDTEMTTVAIPEANVPKIRKLAKKIGVNFRVREYIPSFW
ncbi:MAG: TatD family nuclease-associated radical SAM protein [Candidatus Hodarchaeota archaeon]